MVSELPKSVRDAVGEGDKPLVVVLWRIGCSTSRYALPYWDRLAKRHPEAKIVAICQDPLEATSEYCHVNGITMPMISDGPELRHSRSLEAPIVPAFWVSGSGAPSHGHGWNRQVLEEIDAGLGNSDTPLIAPGESVIDFKPG